MMQATINECDFIFMFPTIYGKLLGKVLFKRFLTAVYKFYLCPINMYSNFNGKAEILSGLRDGLLVPFALGTALASAGMQPVIIFQWVILAGITGGLLMGIAGYNAAKSTYNPENEIKKIQKIYESIGLDKSYQQQALTDIRNEYASLPLNEEYKTSTSKNAAYNFIAYLAGSVITSLPYFFLTATKHALSISMFLTGFFLLLCGYWGNGQNTAQSVIGALRNIFLGLFTGSAAYCIAKLFIADV